jgi:O-antigen/teichoic acid export membrane protein
MNIYAGLSIVEAILKLLIVYFILYFTIDKLILYSILVFIVTGIVNLLYIIYCKKKFKAVCKYTFSFDKNLLNNMISFSGWNLLGGVTGVAVNEGPNYFINIFLGVGVNAAMGIAKQVGSAVYSFTANFQTAFNPQIVKLYAAKDKENLFDLIYRSSMVSYYLIFIISLPIILCANTLLVFGWSMYQITRHNFVF